MKRFLTALFCAILLVAAMCAVASAKDPGEPEQLIAVAKATAFTTMAIMLVIPKKKDK